MAITQSSARQYALVADVEFTYAELTDGSPENAIEVPQGATVIAAELITTVAFDSVTSDTLTVAGAGVTASAVDATSTGQETVTLDGSAVGTGGTTITVQWDQVGGSTTAGTAKLIVTYIHSDRSNENFDL